MSDDLKKYLDVAERARLGRDDIGNGTRLAAMLEGDAIYVTGRGWGVWDGKRYDFETGEIRALHMSRRLQEAVLAEGDYLAQTAAVTEYEIQAKMEDTSEGREHAIRQIRKSRSNAARKFAGQCGLISRMRAALELSKTPLCVAAGDLDGSLGVIQVGNGTLDLDKLCREPPDAEEHDERIARLDGCLTDHDRRSLPTRACVANFTLDAEAPQFMRFLELALPDEAERRYAQRMAGALLGGQRDEVFFVLLGAGGNGKSTFVKAIQEVMGNYAVPCRIEMFCENRQASENTTTPGEAALPGARAWLAEEPQTSAILDAGKIKGLTGGNDRQVNPKMKAVFNYEPTGIPVLQVNKMPRVNDPSDGFWRRFFSIEFRQPLAMLRDADRISSSEMRAHIKAERDGIMRWMVEGFIEYRTIGLNPTLTHDHLKASLRALADPVGEFLEARVLRRRGTRIATTALYKAYAGWSEAQGEKPFSRKAFTAQMQARHMDQRKSNGTWYWLDCELLPAEDYTQDQYGSGGDGA